MAPCAALPPYCLCLLPFRSPPLQVSGNRPSSDRREPCKIDFAMKLARIWHKNLNHWVFLNRKPSNAPFLTSRSSWIARTCLYSPPQPRWRAKPILWRSLIAYLPTTPKGGSSTVSSALTVPSCHSLRSNLWWWSPASPSSSLLSSTRPTPTRPWRTPQSSNQGSPSNCKSTPL